MLDHDLLEQLAEGLRPNRSGEHWGKQDEKRKANLPQREWERAVGYVLGNQGDKHTQLQAEMLWFEASPARDFPMLGPKRKFTVVVSRLETLRFSLEILLKGPVSFFYGIGKQAVLEPMEHVGKTVRIAQMPRIVFKNGKSKRIVQKNTIQARTITWNGPRSFEIDRPLDFWAFDMVAAFNDPEM
jgi:hypothetical protein